MKCLMVGSDVFSKSRAWVPHFVGVANGLEQLGWTVCVYSMAYKHRPDQRLQQYLNNDVVIFQDGETGGRDRLRRLRGKYFIGLVRGICSLFHIVRTNVIQCVYFRSSMLTLGWVILLGKYLKKRKIITIFEHNGWLADDVNQNLPRSKAFFWPRFAKFLQVAAAKSISMNRVVTPGIGDLLVQNGVNRSTIFVAGNGTNTTHFRPMEKHDCCSRFNLDPSLTYIGYIGRLAYWQGVEFLLYSLRDLNFSPSLRLLIGGDGPAQTRLEEIAEEIGVADIVLFMDSIPYDLAPVFINCFDVAVYTPIVHRNQKIGISPLKVRDYAACGKPVVATKVKGLEDIEKGGFGLLANPEDSQDIADKIRVLLNESRQRSLMGNKARAFAEKHYKWDAIAVEIDLAIQSAMR